MGTPPIASTMSRSPTKSTSTSPSSRTPVSSSTVFHVHPDADSMSWPSVPPDRERLVELPVVSRAGVVRPVRHRARRPVGHQVPGDRHQLDPGPVGGHVRDDRRVGVPSRRSSPPIVAFSPLRSSDPMISRFTGVPARASPGGGSVACGRALSSPTRPVRSTSVDVRLELPVHGGRRARRRRRGRPRSRGRSHDGPVVVGAARACWLILRTLVRRSVPLPAGRRGGPVRVCG